MDDFQPITDQSQPERMFKTVIIVVERLLSIERRININALHLARIIRFQRLEREQIVAVDQHIAENVAV